MQKFQWRQFIVASHKIIWLRWLAGPVCIAAILALGLLRTATDAEFSFASLVLLPVIFIAWINGKWAGLLFSLLAAAMWAAGDIAAERSFSAEWIPWVNMITRLTTYSLVTLLVAELHRQMEREHAQATQDALTHLSNRRAFEEAGESEIDRSQRYAHSLALVFLDLDDFKCLNDTHGHEAGDAALQTCARTLLATLRSSDHVARIGGDEFAVLLPELDYAAASEAGRKICASLELALKPFPPVKASVGVAWFESADRPFVDMLKAADELMYAAKQHGKGQTKIQRFTAKAPVTAAPAA